MSNVLISVVSEFDKKGFTQADKSASSLEKSMNRLAKATLGALSIQRILAYSKASIKAYAEDQRAAALLSNQLKNLGLAYAAVDVESFIAKLQEQTGILDDELRPAFAQLARVTGSVAESQKLMAVAFDASRGAGIGYMNAVEAISQAYVGNKRGLRQLNLGLTQAELAAMDFDQILNKITKHFKGAGAASLDTFAGKLDLLKVSTENAKETIGEGFVDAFTLIANDQDFKNVLAAIDGAALAVADMIRGVGVALKNIDEATPAWLKSLLTVESIPIVGSYLKYFQQQGQQQRATAAIGTGGGYYAKVAKDKLAAAAEKRRQDDLLKKERERLALLKKQTDQKKAQAAIDKANALIAKAKEQFDLEGIQLKAALANERISIEERKRLEVMQATWELEQAIAQNDQLRIDAATALLTKLLAQFEVMNSQLVVMNEMYKLFASLGVDRQLIDLLNLEDALNLMNQMALLGQLTLPANFPKPTSTMVTKQEADAALAAATTPEAVAWDEVEKAKARNRASFVGMNPLPTGSLPTTNSSPINITVNGAIDAEGTARTIVDVLSRSYGRGALPAELLIL